LNVPRKQGGRGLIQLEEPFIVEVINLMDYVDSKEGPLILTVRRHKHNPKATMSQTARRLKTQLRRRTKQIKIIIAEKTKERWQEKRINGQFSLRDEKLVDKE
jgi:hypothetical protein